MEYLIKASVVVILFYLCFSLFLKKETFFQHNRWFLLIGLIIALIFPFIIIPVYIAIEPAVTSEVIHTQNIFTQAITSNQITTQPENAFDWTQLLSIIYSIGFVVFLIQFILQFGSLALLLLKNPKYKDELFTYVIVKNKISPFSFFKWIVYNPEAFNENELELILTHEKVHAKQLHSIDLLLTQLACIIFWFNPLIWLYRKEVRQNLEYIADNKTQSTSVDEKTYQHLLLKTSVANHNISLSNNFYNSLIKERIVMLKKSRSNKKKQWRYLLMLPLLAGLLMSMNTETIYVETESHTIANKKTIEFVVTKNTTDQELKAMSDKFEKKGITLIFSKVKRNNSDELTSLFLKLNNHSYGGGNSNSPIDSFIIYKELFDRGGGYVGRINGATLHFDDNTNDKKAIEALQERAFKAILNSGLQSKEDLKNYKKKFLNKNDKTKKKKTLTPAKKSSKSQPNKNTKNIAIATPLKSDKIFQFNGDNLISIITKNSTDSDIDKIKEQLKKEGLTAKFKGIKRNKKGEITAIKIEVKSNNSNTSYNVNSDEAIDSIKIAYDADKNSISIGNSNASHGENTFVFKSKDAKHKIHKSGNGSHVYVISDDEHQYGQDTIYVTKAKASNGKVKTIKSNGKVHVISGDSNDEVIEIIVDEDTNDEKETMIVNGKKKKVWVTRVDDKDSPFILELDDSKTSIFVSDDEHKKPLYIIDGKEVSPDKFKDLKTDLIESMTVLKDKSAIDNYGEKGKNGVIIIKTKKKN